MTPIQSDPARRIRRIHRWLSKCGQMMPSASWLRPYVANTSRWDAADALFAAELDWLCVHSHHQSCTIAEQKARIEELEKQLKDIEIERQDEAYELMEWMTFPE